MKNIGIFGIGCIGSVMAKYLGQNATNNYVYFNRSNKQEVRVQYGDDVTLIPIELVSEKSVSLDWLIICLKQYHIEDASDRLQTLITPNTKLAIFQNGINLASSFLDYAKPENILETIINCPTQKHPKGGYTQLSTPKITLPKTALAEEFVQLFNSPVVDFSLTKRFRRRQWEKLIESAAMGSLQVMKMQPCIIFKDRLVLDKYIHLLREGVEVAKSEGIELDLNYVSVKVKNLNLYPESKGSSMLTDALAGKPLELDAKIGAIVNIGMRNKIKIPTTIQVYNELLRSNEPEY